VRSADGLTSSAASHCKKNNDSKKDIKGYRVALKFGNFRYFKSVEIASMDFFGDLSVYKILARRL
jgi:hypothetical protein